jgi:SAM-dependent methyltransferase
MFDIKKILMCPECKVDLTDDLLCPICHHQYSIEQGVYDLISMNISSDQSFWDEETIEWMNNRSYEEMKENYRLYYACFNNETVEAQKKQDEYVDKILNQLSGVVCDLASGGGGMLQKLLQIKNKNFIIVCTDIEKHVMSIARKRWQTVDKRVYYVSNDIRQMSIKDESFDFLTTLSGFGNIPDAEKYAKEIYRILKPKGVLISQGEYIDKDSESYRLAATVGVERGLVEEYLLEDLKSAGFEIIESKIVATATWAENQGDLIPATGDKKYFNVIQARRPK